MKKIMTREEFKLRWESSDDGGGITYEEIADCAISWGLYQREIEVALAAIDEFSKGE